MEGVAHRNENCKVCMCILFPWPPISPNMEGDAERNENCNVCMCILFLWSPISPTWKGLLKEMWIAMSARVYYSLDHLFPHHGRGCAHKWELQCLYVYIIPLITYFPNMEGLAHRNENCNVCICILFFWSPIFPSLRGILREIGNCNVCMCILFPWSPISANMEGVAHINENCKVCLCILYPGPPIFPTWRVLQREMRTAMSVCVYYSLVLIFPKHGGGCSQKWELQYLYVYIIPLVTYFPKHGGRCSQK